MNSKRKPNIVFILTDDQGIWSLGCYGNKEIRTPNIDALAAGGVRLDNFFCASPVCSPARASLLTGRIPSQHGVHDWIRVGSGEKHKDAPIEYLEGITGYTDLLAADGYVCGISGKWHLGATAFPQKSYSHWFVTLGGSGTYINAPVYRGTVREETEGYITDIITDDALSFIDECAAGDKPFYLNLTYTAPHSPLVDQHKQEYVDYYYNNATFSDVRQDPRSQRIGSHPIDIQYSESFASDKREYLTVRDLLSGYYAAVQGVDDSVGRVVAKLEELGIRDNTLIIFSSDNGFNCGQHGIWGKGNCTSPLNLFDTSVKVPCIFNMPGVIKSGAECEALLSAYDFMPTLLDFAGMENPESDILPGRSFLDALTVGSRGDVEYHESITVYDEYGPVRMARSREWKYIHVYPYGPHELYDLVHDPEERFNLLDENRYFYYGPDFIAAKVVEMRKYLEDWFDKYVIPETDGKKEPVCGRGQLMKVGHEANGKLTFHPSVAVEYNKKK